MNAYIRFSSFYYYTLKYEFCPFRRLLALFTSLSLFCSKYHTILLKPRAKQKVCLKLSPDCMVKMMRVMVRIQTASFSGSRNLASSREWTPPSREALDPFPRRFSAWTSPSMSGKVFRGIVLASYSNLV